MIAAPPSLTLKEVAWRLRVSKRTVRRRVVTADDLAAYLATGKCDSTRQDATPQPRRLIDSARRG